MRRSMLIALAFLVAGFASAQQQEDSEWYLNQTIRDITFVGLSAVSAADLRPIVTPYIGETFTERRFLELQRRLYATDFFELIVPEALRPESGDGVIIQWTATERPTVDEIRFNGNRRIRDADLLDAVLLKPGDMITQASRRVDENAIIALYLESGFPDVQVSSSVDEAQTPQGTEYVVNFDITEGEQVTIREILFSGNNFASESTLRGRMDSKAQNIFNSGDFQASVLQADRVRIEEYYRERGYIDAAVIDVTQEYERDDEEDRTYLVVTVFIEEGEQYTFGGITFEGNTIFGDDELTGLVRLREGSVLNALRLQEGIATVQDIYYQDGYIFNGFNVSESRDEQALTISFTMTIVEQPRAHIENIIVRGNTKTQDYVIEREIPLQVGDVFSVSRIREGIQNLTNLQFFSAINPETPQGSEEGLMDLVINVEEAQTADIRFGVTFGGSTEFPVAGQIGWSDTNFQGRGQTLGFQVNASPGEQLASLNFLESWLGGQRWSLGADITLSHTKETGVAQDLLAPVFSEDDLNAVPDPFQGYYVFSSDTEYPAGSDIFYDAGDVFPDAVTSDRIATYGLVTDYDYAGGIISAIPSEYLMEYDEWSISAGANTGYRFRTALGTLGVSTSLRSSLNFVGYDPAQTRPFDPGLRANLDDWQLVNTLSMAGTLDRRLGQILSPSSGYLFKQSVGFTGGILFGDRHYIRTDTTGEGYLTIFDVPVTDFWNWKLVLAAHSGISFILPQFWVPARFQSEEGPIAGTSLLSTNPMYIGRGWDATTGGEALWNNWFELRMPIIEQAIWLDTFLDAVSIWDDPAEITTLGPGNMLYSIGGGIRFTIPQFPIALYLAKRFRIPGTQVDGRWIDWQEGDYFRWNESNPNGGLDFVFSIGADFF
jgi:outer membrane protein insertion porin family